MSNLPTIRTRRRPRRAVTFSWAFSWLAFLASNVVILWMFHLEASGQLDVVGWLRDVILDR